ncbi:MAG: dTDP-4-dehydrorhamnose 3,5-epimerase family protein [Candidatus Bathyarchaeia archaeon]
MIQGVATRQLRVIADERGWLMEVLRRDWETFEKFGQAYITAAYPQVVKAWHMHKKQTDNIACIKGMVKLVLYDARKNSKTKGEINEFVIGEKNPILVKIPPQVWHGFKTLSEETAIVMNVPTKLYNYKNPDEHRLPPDTDRISYDWKLSPWRKHG